MKIDSLFPLPGLRYEHAKKTMQMKFQHISLLMFRRFVSWFKFHGFVVNKSYQIAKHYFTIDIVLPGIGKIVSR